MCGSSDLVQVMYEVCVCVCVCKVCVCVFLMQVKSVGTAYWCGFSMGV